MGDFSANFHRPESGIHTVEGNVAGARAARLTKQRQEQQQEFEKKKQSLNAKSSAFSEKFAGHSDSTAELEFKKRTVGLVTAKEFKQAAQAENKVDEEAEKLKQQELEKKLKAERKAKKKAAKQKRKAMSALSFAHEDESLNEAQEESTRTKFFKDPTVRTSFLPDKARDEAQEAKRQELEEEWKSKQEQIKEEQLEIVYSYWDGSGHRRKVLVKKGDTIGHFLNLVRRDLSKEFKELQSISADELLYVKEDLMLPHDLRFYDLIVTRARGKSGPLFHFDVHEDVRIGAINVNVEKDESHPGKVVERKWYDRNKHIFPASRWEVYDATKTYGTYTIHGGEVVTKKQRK